MFPAFAYAPQQSNPTVAPTVDNADSGIKNLQAPSSAPDSIRNSFIPPNMTAPFYNASNVFGNLGSYAGAMIPQSANFMNQLWNPNLNSMEQSFLAAGQANAQKLMENAMGQVDAQFETSPYSSARLQMQGDVINQFAKDAMQQAAGLGLQRQQLGLQASQFPWQAASSFADQNMSTIERLMNVANNAFNNPFSIALPFFTGAPFAAPQTLTTQGGGKSG